MRPAPHQFFPHQVHGIVAARRHSAAAIAGRDIEQICFGRMCDFEFKLAAAN